MSEGSLDWDIQIESRPDYLRMSCGDGYWMVFQNIFKQIILAKFYYQLRLYFKLYHAVLISEYNLFESARINRGQTYIGGTI